MRRSSRGIGPLLLSEYRSIYIAFTSNYKPDSCIPAPHPKLLQHPDGIGPARDLSAEASAKAEGAHPKKSSPGRNHQCHILIAPGVQQHLDANFATMTDHINARPRS
jgi:hypothetical protein